jgi:hypothetical protein
MNKLSEYLSSCFTSADLAKYPGLVRNNHNGNDRVFNPELPQFGIISRPVTEFYSLDLNNL